MTNNSLIYIRNRQSGAFDSRQRWTCRRGPASSIIPTTKRMRFAIAVGPRLQEDRLPARQIPARWGAVFMLHDVRACARRRVERVTPRRRRRADAETMTVGNLRRWLAVVTAVCLQAFAAAGSRGQDIFNGEALYEAHCARCHGPQGVPVLPGTPDFTRGEGLIATDRTLMQSVQNGKGLMPSFDHVLSEQEMLDVITYARTLQR